MVPYPVAPGPHYRVATLPRRSLLQVYSDLAQTRPLLTNLGTGLALGAAGDLVAQNAEKQCAGDWRRLLALSSFTGWYSAWACPLVYSAYDSLLPASWLADKLKCALGKSLLDNFVHGPFLYFPAFYAYVGAVQGQNAAAIWSACSQDLVYVTLVHAAFWGPIMGLVFGVVPAHLRIAVVNASTLVWTVFMSALSQTGIETELGLSSSVTEISPAPREAAVAAEAAVP